MTSDYRPVAAEEKATGSRPTPWAGAAWIGTSCFAAYTACYIAKNVLSAVMPQMLAEGILDDAALGMMGSAFLFTYGVGQFINGLIGNRVNPLYMIFLGLLLPGGILLIFPFFLTPAAGILFWCVCGFLCSMLWGPISRVIGENTTPKTAGLLLTAMTVASILGSLITYALAMAAAFLNEFRFAFFASGGWMTLTALLWFTAYQHMRKRGIVKSNLHATASGNRNLRGFLRLFLQGGFLCMTAIAMLNGIIRNAVAFWIPTFLSQRLEIATEWVPAVSSALPLINMLGTFGSVWLLRLAGNRESRLCAVLFLFSAVLFVAVYLCPAEYAAISVIALFLANAAMMGVCNLIFSFYTLRFSASGMISGVTGFLDAASYLAASGASALFTSMLLNSGWDMVIATWIVMMILGFSVSAISDKWYEAPGMRGGKHGTSPVTRS